MKLVVLVGPPGSGKSTFAKKHYAQYEYVNQDSQGPGHREKFVVAVQDKKNIVVDRMNFNKEQRKRYIEPAKAAGYEVEIHVLHESKDTCHYRCSKRLDHETIKTEDDAFSAIGFFFTHYEKPTVDEGKIVMHYPAGEKPSAIVCDLDGTLCDINHRLHWVRGEGKKNWPMFFAGIKDDTCNEWCINLLNGMKQDKTVLCSGRGSEYREPTVEWLRKEFVVFDHLFMREEGDYRQDSIIKEIILDFEILTRYTPMFFIDDRQQVVDMFRSRGFTVLQCAKGDF